MTTVLGDSTELLLVIEAFESENVVPTVDGEWIVEIMEVMLDCVNGCAVISIVASEEEISAGGSVADVDVVGGFCAVSGGFVSSLIGSSVRPRAVVNGMLSKGGVDDVVLLILVVVGVVICHAVSSILVFMELLVIVLRLVKAIVGETVAPTLDVSSADD